jgi:hypothetical protein
VGKVWKGKIGIKINTCLDDVLMPADFVNITEAVVQTIFASLMIIAEDKGYFDFSLMTQNHQ